MIHIENGQNIPENETLRVYSETGDYNDSDFIEFYNINEPGIIAGAFHAQYVKYGSLVYMFNDPKELGEEILKIDRESTHTAASFVRMQNELLIKLNGGELEPQSLQEVFDNEQEIMEDRISENEEIIEDISNSNVEDGLTEENVTENTKTEIPVEDIIENLENVPETEILEEKVIETVPEIIETEIIPEVTPSTSLSEEIISYARNRKAKKIKNNLI